MKPEFLSQNEVNKDQEMATFVENAIANLGGESQTFQDAKISSIKRVLKTQLATFKEKKNFLKHCKKVENVLAEFRTTFNPANKPDFAYLDQLNKLKQELLSSKLLAIRSFVEKETRSEQAEYQNLVKDIAKLILKYIQENKPHHALDERLKLSLFQLKQQTQEHTYILNNLGISTSRDDEFDIFDTTKTAMLAADQAMEHLLFSEDNLDFSPHTREIAAAMDKNYAITNSLVNTAARDGLNAIDVFIESAPLPNSSIPDITAISGTDFSEKPIKVAFEYGLVTNAGSETNDLMVAKNVAGILAAKQLVRNAELSGMKQEQVFEFFQITKAYDYKRLLNIVKTLCDELQGNKPESLGDNLPTFGSLNNQEKKLVVDALLKANAAWKISPEDRAIYETLQEVENIQDSEAVATTFEAKAKRRIGDAAMGSFLDMATNKGWAEVSKDLFQICQGLVQVEAETVSFDQHGRIKGMLTETTPAPQAAVLEPTA